MGEPASESVEETVHAEAESLACLRPGQQSGVSEGGVAPEDLRERGRARWHMKRDRNRMP